MIYIIVIPTTKEESLSSSVIPRLGGEGMGETIECPIGSITSPTPGLEAFPAQAGNYQTEILHFIQNDKLIKLTKNFPC